jgi:hypothetical protein
VPMSKSRCALVAALCIICCNRAYAAECAGKTVAQCADALAKKVDVLEKENTKLQKDLNDQAKMFDNKLEELRKNVGSVDKRLDKLSNETAVIRPGGQGCLLVRFTETPPGYPTAGAFSIGMANPGTPFEGAGVFPFAKGLAMNPSWTFTHGLIACAK